MEPIKLKGVEIKSLPMMQQSGEVRMVLELTLEDTKLYAGSLMTWCSNKMLTDVVLTPSQIQGNEKSVEKLTLKGQGSIYQWFKNECEKLGKDYDKEKKRIFDENKIPYDDSGKGFSMSNLEQHLPLEKIESILKDRMGQIREEIGYFNQQI